MSRAENTRPDSKGAADNSRGGSFFSNKKTSMDIFGDSVKKSLVTKQIQMMTKVPPNHPFEQKQKTPEFVAFKRTDP